MMSNDLAVGEDALFNVAGCCSMSNTCLILCIAVQC